MFENLKLTPKIAGSIAVTLLVTSVAGFFVTQNRINKQAEAAFVDKLRKTDGMADKALVFFSANIDLYVPNHQFKELKQVPVVVAWSVAREHGGDVKLISSREGETIFRLTVARHLMETTGDGGLPRNKVLTS